MKKKYLIEISLMITFLFILKNQALGQIIGRWPYGACNTVIVDSNIAYIGTGGVIMITDMTDPSTPVELSRIETPGAVWNLFKSGNYSKEL